MLEDKNVVFTPLDKIGEFELIKILTEKFQLKQPSSLLGVGDDAAVIEISDDKVLVATTDILIEHVHFDLTWMPLKHLGYKAVIANLSDVVAMNATPTQILVTIAVSNRFSLEAVQQIYEGIEFACSKYNVDLVGGDTSSSEKGLILSVTAVGMAEKHAITYRKGAQVNDLICVTGDLGAAYAGLLVLQREKVTFEANPNIQPDLQGYEYVIERQIKPEARLDILEKFKSFGIKPSSMIDISDGLSSELLHICSQSHVGCKIFEEKIPIDIQTQKVADEFNIPELTMALNGGEDYELLFTISVYDYDKIKNRDDIAIIGYITSPESGRYLINKAEQEIELKARGWNAFGNKP
ncbi:MAG: thiamine-phosphate kinase [Bacteroidales bacterium]|nr:thiamine-phosphate kinase [Bacteroidales bacterium]